jgi:hypothetical protein
MPRVASGATYSVTVVQQPSNPSQTCTVANDIGIVTDVNVTNVEVACVTNAFTIGGTVAGLTGNGLALSMNGVTLPVTGTSFTFPAIPSGTAWAVTVAMQPRSPSQTCTVTNGTGAGTVTSANVTTVAVTCTTNSYSVSGTITGLVGAGLLLSLNNGAGQPASGSGFTLTPPIPSEQAYSVVVLTQPTSPSQTCVVDAGSGTVAGENVTTVEVTCRTNTYPVGGTIIGLSAPSLGLRLNGQPPQSFSGPSFTFTAQVESGQSYSVTVATQPTSPSQTCTVGSGAGVVGATAVTNVVVTCVTNTFTVGGTITDLFGTGLQLKLNGGPAQSVSGSSFTLTPALPSGQPYIVDIASTPTSPSQSCILAGAMGTVAAANVTNVVVKCTIPAYSVGGSISGLAGAGLQLRLNNGAAQAVSGPSFTLMPSIATGQPYGVAVAQQPTNPWQTCTVANGSGTIGNANVTNVAVTCATNAYTVGGSITGLTGAGLELRLNSGAAQSVSGTSFSLGPPSVMSGQAYAVTIAKQPTNQLCTVVNGAGTVGGSAPVVSVSCTDAFPVGGTVSGLAGTGLTLSLNSGAQSVSPTTNGAFTFPAPLVNGSAYTVTVAASPATQACSVSLGSGAVANANVTSIAVTCFPTWSIGGSVTGLMGTGLQLSLNGGPAATLVGAGVYALSTRVPHGSTYAVAITSQPTGQLCVVVGSSGTATANVSTVNLFCAATPASCNAWHTAYPTLASGVFPIRPASTTYDVYCDKTTLGGGWTLVMKLDGTSPLFNYDSASWLDASTLNATSPDVSDTQMKSQAYGEVGFTQLLVGLREGADLRTTAFTVTASSALAMVTSGMDFGTRAEWMSLSANAALQVNCNVSGSSKRGAHPGAARVRIGSIANNEADCVTHDSYIGLGGQSTATCLGGAGVSAGNRACFEAVTAMGAAATDRNAPAWGYLWVR